MGSNNFFEHSFIFTGESVFDMEGSLDIYTNDRLLIQGSYFTSFFSLVPNSQEWFSEP